MGSEFKSLGSQWHWCALNSVDRLIIRNGGCEYVWVEDELGKEDEGIPGVHPEERGTVYCPCLMQVISCL